jgi:hypothetical protein
VFADARYTADGNTADLIVQLDDGQSANRDVISFRNELSGNQIRAANINFSASPAGQDFYTLTGTVAGSAYRTAFALKTNDMAAASGPGGFSPIPTNSTRILQSKTTLRIGAGISNANPLCGHISRLTYWPQRLPNDTLQTITQ